MVIIDHILNILNSLESINTVIYDNPYSTNVRVDRREPPFAIVYLLQEAELDVRNNLKEGCNVEIFFAKPTKLDAKGEELQEVVDDMTDICKQFIVMLLNDKTLVFNDEIKIRQSFGAFDKHCCGVSVELEIKERQSHCLDSVEPSIRTLDISANGEYDTIQYGKVDVNVELHPVIEELSATENAVYVPVEGVDGFNPVRVNVQPPLQELTATENRIYTPQQGYYGFSSVDVSVEGGGVSGYVSKVWRINDSFPYSAVYIECSYLTSDINVENATDSSYIMGCRVTVEGAEDYVETDVWNEWLYGYAKMEISYPYVWDSDLTITPFIAYETSTNIIYEGESVTHHTAEEIQADYVYFEAKEPNSTVGIHMGTTDPHIQVSTDKLAWSELTSISESTPVVLQNVGDKLYARKDPEYSYTSISSSPTAITPSDIYTDYDFTNCTYFVTTGDLKVGGDIGTLYNTFGYQNTGATSIYVQCAFHGCTAITDASDLKFEPYDVGGHSYEFLFHGCSEMIDGPTHIHFSEFSSNMHYAFRHTFDGCEKMRKMPIIDKIVSNPGAYQFDGTFINCKAMTTQTINNIPSQIDLSGVSLVTANTHTLCRTFDGCSSLTSTPIVLWGSDTTMVTPQYFMYATFKNCTSLTTPYDIPFGGTLGAYSLRETYSGCTSLTRVAVINSSKTITATNICARMYENCTGLNGQIELTGGNNMGSAHYFRVLAGCTNITSVIIRNSGSAGSNCFDEMFDGCVKLSYIKTYNTGYNSTAFDYWLRGCASEGNIDIVNQTLYDRLPTGTDSGVPTGWTKTKVAS